MRLSVCGGASGVPISRHEFLRRSFSFPIVFDSAFFSKIVLSVHLPSVHAIHHQGCVKAIDFDLGPRRLPTANSNLSAMTQPELLYERPASLTFVLNKQEGLHHSTSYVPCSMTDCSLFMLSCSKAVPTSRLSLASLVPRSNERRHLV